LVSPARRCCSARPVSLQYLLQSLGTPVPYQVFLALPYVLTLAVLAVTGRARQPAWLVKPLP